MQLTPYFPRIHGKAGRLAGIIAFGFLGITASLPAQEDLIEIEFAKRKALVEEARELASKGEEVLLAGRADQAVLAFEGALELLPNAPALAEMRAKVTQLLVEASVAQAKVLADQGDLVAAKELMARVLAKEVAPAAPAALEMLERLNDPVRTNQARGPKLFQDVEKVLELIRKADGAVQLGLYDEAKVAYEQILLVDPYNRLARRGLENINRLKTEAYVAAYDHARSEMINQVAQAWEMGLTVDPGELPELTVPGGGVDQSEIGEATMTAKLKGIFIPQIALSQVTLVEAIDFLRFASVREDTMTKNLDQRGVNFTLNLGPPESDVATRLANQRFDLKLKNVPLAQALRYINQITGTAYTVDAYAVVIRPAGEVTDEMISRSYSTPPNFIGALTDSTTSQTSSVSPFDAPAGGQGLLTERRSALDLLKQMGVPFPDGSVASYNASLNLLRVVNTPRNHDIIDQVIENISKTDPVMISVQVTMIKTQQSNLKELGFDWLLNPVDLGQNAFLGGGTEGNNPGRTALDMSPALPGLPTNPSSSLSGLVTNGLRSGDQSFIANSLDALVNNPERASQAARVAPGILSLSGVFTDGQAQLMMRGLDQSTGIDMMAQPSTVVRSGESSKITLVREFIYPSEYETPELQSGGGRSTSGSAFPVTPANPTAFDMREVGISLEVLPVADDQKNYISLTLNPSIVEFDGFVNFGSPINTALTDGLGNPVTVRLTDNRILMPVFSTKRATTQLTVADGATVAFGGLLSERIQRVEDKVPVLGSIPMIGRLFSSQSNLPVSTAIVFLVHVELMDPTGRSYRDEINR